MNLIQGFKGLGDMLTAAPDLLASTVQLGENAKADAAEAQAVAAARPGKA
jgi:hypothetical protein